MRAKATGVGPPITLIAPGLDLSLTMAPNLITCVQVGGQVCTAPIIQQLLGGLLVTETSLDCKN